MAVAGVAVAGRPPQLRAHQRQRQLACEQFVEGKPRPEPPLRQHVGQFDRQVHAVERLLERREVRALNRCQADPFREIGKLLQVGNRLEVAGRLLGSVATVEVGADGDVPRVAGDLADVVDVVDDAGDCDQVARRLQPNVAGMEHPVVERRADDPAALDDEADLVVGELTVAGDERAAVVVAGEDRPVKDL